MPVDRPQAGIAQHGLPSFVNEHVKLGYLLLGSAGRNNADLGIPGGHFHGRPAAPGYAGVASHSWYLVPTFPIRAMFISKIKTLPAICAPLTNSNLP